MDASQVVDYYTLKAYYNDNLPEYLKNMDSLGYSGADILACWKGETVPQEHLDYAFGMFMDGYVRGEILTEMQGIGYSTKQAEIFFGSAYDGWSMVYDDTSTTNTGTDTPARNTTQAKADKTKTGANGLPVWVNTAALILDLGLGIATKNGLIVDKNKTATNVYDPVVAANASTSGKVYKPNTDGTGVYTVPKPAAPPPTGIDTNTLIYILLALALILLLPYLKKMFS